MTVDKPGLRVDTSRPHPARVYDWLLGGKDNHPVDQRVAEQLPAEARGNAARNRSEVEPFFEGLELVEPGLVSATEWYREEPAPVRERSGLYAGVGRVH